MTSATASTKEGGDTHGAQRITHGETGGKMNFEERIEELFIDIPEPGQEPEHTAFCSKTGKILFLTGQLPYSEGRLAYKGRVGLEVTVEAGRAAARAATVQALGVLKNQLKSLNKIKKIIHADLSVATGAEFKEHHKIIRGTTELLREIFGVFGKCSTNVIGCASLPEGATVQLSLIVEIK